MQLMEREDRSILSCIFDIKDLVLILILLSFVIFLELLIWFLIRLLSLACLAKKVLCALIISRVGCWGILWFVIWMVFLLFVGLMKSPFY